MQSVDVAILGAGPAGMAAAAELAEAGLSCVLLEEQPAAGGQIYRALADTDARRERILGPDYQAGRPLLDGLNHPRIHAVFGATVWQIDADGTVSYSAGTVAKQLRAGHVLLATGAQERPYAFKGWTVPGVMTVGAAQILLKAQGMVPEAAVLAGNGPLLYLFAAQLIAAGYPPAMILETQAAGALSRAMPHLPAALMQGKRYLWKGLKLLATIKRAGIPHYRGIQDLAAHASTANPDSTLAEVSFTHRGQTHTVRTDHLLVHQGVIPNTQFSRALGVAHDWNALQQCWQPRADQWGDMGGQRFAAGDGAGIGGANAVALAGRLSALQIAHQQGRYTQAQRDVRAKPLQRALAQELAVRPFLDALYAPDYRDVLSDDAVMVCRCEEVTSGMLRDHVRNGCLGLNQTKVFSRCGMGPCQGRMCGLTAAQVLADARQVPVSEIDYYRIRMPIKPITLQELAGLEVTGGGEMDLPR